MQKIQMLGFVLWRGGLMLAAGYSLYRGASFLLSYLDIPPQLQVGGGLAIAGFAMVLISLFIERRVDARSERGFGE